MRDFKEAVGVGDRWDEPLLVRPHQDRLQGEIVDLGFNSAWVALFIGCKGDIGNLHAPGPLILVCFVQSMLEKVDLARHVFSLPRAPP